MTTLTLPGTDTLDPQVARGRYAVAMRDHDADSERVIAARQDLIEANLAAAVRKAGEGGHALRREQVVRLSALLDTLCGED